MRPPGNEFPGSVDPRRLKPTANAVIGVPFRGLFRDSAGEFIPRRRVRSDSTLLFGKLLGVMAIGTAVFGACSSEKPAAPPKIVFHDTTHDFGRAAQGTTITHSYAFRNAGGLDLTIDNVRASCACTAAAASGRVVPPGGQGAIEASLDTAHDFGRKTRTITVYSNDPAQPVTTLTLVGDVDAEIAADPPELYVGHVTRGQMPRNDVRLLTANTVAARTAEAGGRVVDASLENAAGAQRIRVAIKPDAPLGRFKESVVVHTDSPRRTELAIPVIGVVDADGPSGGGVAENKG